MVYIDWYSPTGFDCIERVLEGVDTRVARVYFLGILVKQHMEFLEFLTHSRRKLHGRR